LALKIRDLLRSCAKPSIEGDINSDTAQRTLSEVEGENGQRVRPPHSHALRRSADLSILTDDHNAHSPQIAAKGIAANEAGFKLIRNIY
jgi:hypothetical protein